MTTTTKVNPTELLSQLAHSQSSGCLELDEGLVSWKIYIQQGQLQYVDCSAQLLDQLKYYLQFLGWKPAILGLKNLPVSYLKIQTSVQDKSAVQNFYSDVICWLLAQQYLDRDRGLKLLEHITKDTLRSCLWLDRGTSLWKEGEPIPQWIGDNLGSCSSLNISECLSIEKTRLQQWQNCSSQLLSTHQRPYFTSGWEQKDLPSSGSLSQQHLKELSKVIKGRTSIRQLSVLLQKDELQVAQILSPYMDHKIVFLRHAQPPLDKLPSIPRIEESSVTNNSESKNPETSKKPEVKTWKIVCIDDSPTILNEIKRFLDSKKFEVTAIDDPVQAASIIFRIKPDLILLDITMPRINGYKLCGLLRGSKHCNQTPIIMVTGNTGLIDKARAKIAGATDYFTKPFTKNGLMQIVEKHLDK
jgi:twitching motility two-component system response regulator PilG